MGQDSVLVWPRSAFSVEVMLLPAPRAVSFWLVDHLGHVWFLPQALSGSQARHDHLLEKSVPCLCGQGWTNPVVSCPSRTPRFPGE